MKKYAIIIIAFLVNSCSLKEPTEQTQNKNGSEDIDVIIQVAQRAYYENNDYEKAINVLSKAVEQLQPGNISKYQDIIDLKWHQIQFTLFEKGAITAKIYIDNLMKYIESYHAKQSSGFSMEDNAGNLVLIENVSKHFIYYPNGNQVIGSILNSFIEIYKKDFSGEQHLRMFQSLKSYIELLNGDLKSALNLSLDVMRRAEDYEKNMYSINYGHALFFNKQGTDKAIGQYKIAFKLDEELIEKTLLMDFQTLRQFNFDISALKNYENQIKAQYLKKYYKRPYITEIKGNSQAGKIGLKVGDIIELYNNELIYDLEMFGIDRMSDRFKQNLRPREIKVLRNGKHLTFTVTPGLLGVYLDYKK